MNTRDYLLITNEDMANTPGLFDLVMSAAAESSLWAYSGAYFAVPLTHPHISMILLKLDTPDIRTLPLETENVSQIVL